MKHRSVSLTIKVNILLTAIIMVVGGVLLLIGSNTFVETVFEPYRDRLAGIEVKDEELSSLIAAFVERLNSDAYRQKEREIGADPEAWASFIQDQPGLLSQEDLGIEEDYSLTYDYMSLMLKLMELTNRNALATTRLEARKEDTFFLLTSVTANYDLLDGDIDLVSLPGPYRYPTTDYAEPVLTSDGSRTVWLRCIPIEAGDAMGYLWMTYDMTDMSTAYNAYIWGSAAYVLLVILVAGLISMHVMQRIVTRPLRRLTKATGEFAADDDGYSRDDIISLNIQSHDEIGELYQQIRAMQTHIVEDTENLTHMSAERQRIATELDMARRIQESMLPNNFPDQPEFDLYALMDPAKEVGGDFYDFFLIDPDHLCLVIADVSGKGIPAALFMMLSKIILQSCAMLGQSVADILQKTNEAICSNNKLQMFVTVWLGVLEISTGKMTCANAGHEYPALCHNGQFELLKDRHGLMIGAMNGMFYQDYTLQLQPGDRLFVYTDGVAEATNRSLTLYGTGRMIDALNLQPDGTPEQIIGTVRRDVDRFVGDAEQFDDITMLCLAYKGTGKAD